MNFLIMKIPAFHSEMIFIAGYVYPEKGGVWISLQNNFHDWWYIIHKMEIHGFSLKIIFLTSAIFSDHKDA